jgi:dTDP-4-amino-4,6-dideoxygalactose transaminase
MKVPLLDLMAQDGPLLEELRGAVATVAGSGSYIRGPELQAFQSEFATAVGVKHAIGVASGTDALELALQALDIGPGDEVITTAFTFFATAEAICQRGARPVFVDIDPQTYTLAADHVEAAITERTRALLPVHLFGHPADMYALNDIARRHGLAVVEDCAQAFGATQHDRAVGSLGDAGAFSFYPTKTLGAWGDGGMVTTSCTEMAERLSRLGNHGQVAGYVHTEIARNSRLDDLQAAVLRVKLRHARANAQAREALAQRYARQLSGLEIIVPATLPGYTHGLNYYTVLVEDRDRVLTALGENDIGGNVFYRTPLHRQPVFSAQRPGLALPVTDFVSERCLSLPIYPGLTTAQIDRVARVIGSVVAHAPAAKRCTAQPH